MSVVKSNAYGHGITEIASVLSGSAPKGLMPRRANKKSVGTDWFGIDSIDEALLLKQAGVKKPILILGYIPLNRLKEAVKNKFRFVVYNHETIKTLTNNQQPTTLRACGSTEPKANNPINIHIKVETGTSRQGIGENKILDFVKFIKKFPQIKIEGIYTHFANIEDTTNHSYAQKQLNKFKKINKLLEKEGIKIPIKHTACSAATILFPKTHFDLVRLGIAMYGLWPSKETYVSAQKDVKTPGVDTKLLNNVQTPGVDTILLKPVLTWKTIIAQIKNVKKGTPISYGLTEKVNRDSKIAILPIGYWDGFDRGLSSVGNVLIKGKRCKVLGRVCMNMSVVDVTDISSAKPGDEVVIIGQQGKEQITIEEIAEKLGTINYEVVTRINPVIKRVLV